MEPPLCHTFQLQTPNANRGKTIARKIPCCWFELKPSYKTSAAVIKPLNAFGQAVLSPQSKADVDLNVEKLWASGGVEQLWIQEFRCTVMDHEEKLPMSQILSTIRQLTNNVSQDKEHKFAHAISSRRFLPWVWWKPCWDRHLSTVLPSDAISNTSMVDSDPVISGWCWSEDLKPKHEGISIC